LGTPWLPHASAKELSADDLYGTWKVTRSLCAGCSKEKEEIKIQFTETTVESSLIGGKCDKMNFIEIALLSPNEAIYFAEGTLSYLLVKETKP
jgi:hypothetical protein